MLYNALLGEQKSYLSLLRDCRWREFVVYDNSPESFVQKISDERAVYVRDSSNGGLSKAYNKAAEMEPSKGEPYRLIAQLYVKGAKAISDGMGGRSAYWAAVDAARKALSVDDSPENVEAANRLISTYSGHYPKQDEAFMLDLIDGNSYTVPGWIGVSTTIRTRK